MLLNIACFIIHSASYFVNFRVSLKTIQEFLFPLYQDVLLFSTWRLRESEKALHTLGRIQCDTALPIFPDFIAAYEVACTLYGNLV